MDQPLNCSECGAELKPIKNWSRLSIWRREIPRRCRKCASTKHGMSRTRLYQIWRGMMVRCGHFACSNPDAITYYIERGITVCPEWHDFPEFAEWAHATGYDSSLTIDRVNSDGGYEPSNCRWVSMTENLRSRDDRKLTMQAADEIRKLRAEGVSGSVLAARYGVTRNHIYRIASGGRWSHDID